MNQLYWGTRRELDAFLKAADRVRAADKAALEGQASRGGDAADGDARRRWTHCCRAPRREPLKKGTPLSPALAERLRTTLDAIGAHGSAAARHARGRLQEDLDPPGFAAFAALAGLGRAGGAQAGGDAGASRRCWSGQRPNPRAG